MIKIYGTPRSSAGRCFLMLEEVGLPYTQVDVDMMEKKEHKSEEFLKLNPNGKIPCLVDGDFVVWESMAINFYLAEKYKPELLGSTPETKALALQWSLWALTELQPPMVDLIIQTMFMPEHKRDSGVIARAEEKIPAALAILDRALQGRQFLASDVFSIGDLNVASTVNIANSVKVSLDGYSHILPWFERVRSRPSFQKFVNLRKP